MKKFTFILITCLLLSACGNNAASDTSPPSGTTEPTATTVPVTTGAVEETTVSVTIPTTPGGTEAMETEPADLTRFTLYTPNENADGFLATEVEGEKLTPMEVLIDAGVLTKDVQLNFVKWEDGIMIIDFNAAFRDMLVSQGTAGEKMLMGSVVNTFLSAYQTETMMITIEEEILESGHVIYDFPMGYFK